MHLSRREKGTLVFGVIGAVLWGAVAALRTRPLPAARCSSLDSSTTCAIFVRM